MSADKWKPHYGRLLLVGEAEHQYVRDHLNEALSFQAQGIEGALYTAEPIDRATYNLLTHREPPLNSRRLLAGWSTPSPFASSVLVFTVAELREHPEAEAHEQAVSAMLRNLDEQIPGMVCPQRARSRKARDRFEHQRQRQIYDAQRALRGFLKLNQGAHEISPTSRLFVTCMALPCDPETGMPLEVVE